MENNQSTPTDFVLQRPKTQLFPVVFNSPHSGNLYPDEFIKASKLSKTQLRASEDCFVDELFNTMPELGCPMLSATFPRAFLDVNRGPWELDPKMFSDKLPAHVETATLRVIAGLGTIAKRVSENREIYHTKLKFCQAKARIERYYFPYHKQLKQLLDGTCEQFGQAVLIDCHSMPSSATRWLNWASAQPDIILGDGFGSACDGEFVALLERLFNDAGLNTTRNKPYAGGFITKTYGKPENAIHAIQIEINRQLYMDEKRLQPTRQFPALQNTINNVFRQFLAQAPLSTEIIGLAAE
jgi:N-formylglutamate amidohydrolase